MSTDPEENPKIMSPTLDELGKVFNLRLQMLKKHSRDSELKTKPGKLIHLAKVELSHARNESYIPKIRRAIAYLIIELEWVKVKVEREVER